MPNLTIRRNDRVHKAVSDALLRNYWDSTGEALRAIDAAMEKHHMFLDIVDCSGPEGRTTLRILADKGYRAACMACTDGSEFPAFDNTLSISWYAGPLGRWVIRAYIS